MRNQMPLGELTGIASTDGPASPFAAAPSILFPMSDAPSATNAPPTPVLLADLNLDQVINSVTAGKDEYDLKPVFLATLTKVDDIAYRQEVFADLEDEAVHEILASFAAEQLVAKFTYRVHDLHEDDHGYDHYHRERFFLNTAEHYCGAVNRLASGLEERALFSRALRGLREYLAAYVVSDAFTALEAETRHLEEQLDAVRYCVLVKGDRITVGAFDDEDDYSEQVTTTFARFQQGAVHNYLPEFRDQDSFAGAGVLDLVAKVYPELFGTLDAFCARHLDYLDDAVRVLDRELQFYLSYLDYIRPLRDTGLSFGTPYMSATSKNEQVLDTFDLALAAQLSKQGTAVVCNDLTVNDPERILVISGPNNGGKTTLARAFGQLHYLARLGCPVPGHDVRLFLCDQIYTHFEKEEDITTLAGKLQDELNRLKADFDHATPASVFVLNEVFNSTSAQDALLLSRQILEKIGELDALCVCVTFLDELSTLSQKTVSMVSTVEPKDPAVRTHKVIRKPADGRAYAQAIADKYGLTYERLTAEILR